MKRILPILAAAVCLVCCGLLYHAWLNTEPETPLVGFISTAEGELPHDLEQVRGRLEADGWHTAAQAGCTDLQAAVTQLTQQGASVLIFHIEGNLPDADFTAPARAAGVAMIFAGQAPVRALNTQYDKIWYLGSSTADAGELLGQQVAAAFRAGSLPDADGDLILDYLVLTDGTSAAEEILDAAEWEYSRYGVIGADCEESVLLSRAAAPSASTDLTAKWAALGQRPELILCIGAEYARAAHAAAGQLGWLEGESPVYLAAVVENSELAQELLALGGFCGLVHYDEAAEQAALYTMTVNLLNSRDVAYGTELRRDITSPQFDLPFVPVEITLPEPQTADAAE